MPRRAAFWKYLMRVSKPHHVNENIKRKHTLQLYTNGIYPKCPLYKAWKTRMTSASLFVLMKETKCKLYLAFKTKRPNSAWVHRRQHPARQEEHGSGQQDISGSRRLWLEATTNRISACQQERTEAATHYAASHIQNYLNLYAPCVLYIGQAFRYSPENAFYIFNQ